MGAKGEDGMILGRRFKWLGERVAVTQGHGQIQSALRPSISAFTNDVDNDVQSLIRVCLGFS